MRRPQVFVYLKSGDKKLVSEVTERLGMKEAALFRALALPSIYQIHKALEKGASAIKLRHTIKKRLEGSDGS